MLGSSDSLVIASVELAMHSHIADKSELFIDGVYHSCHLAIQLVTLRRLYLAEGELTSTCTTF